MCVTDTLIAEHIANMLSLLKCFANSRIAHKKKKSQLTGHICDSKGK